MRNRRNTRKRNVVLDTITNRNFIIIVSILLAVIIVAEGVIQIRKYQDRKLLAKQAEELEKQTGEIFTAIENNLTSPSNNGETTVITRTARISAVGDILCQMDMIDDAKIDDGYDFSHMFTGISKFVKNSDIAIGTLETNFVDGKYFGVGKYNSPIEFLKAVKDSGIGLVSLAHNHVLDYGNQGLETTISKIKEQNVEITGIKNKVDESNENTLDEEKTKEQESSNFTGNIKEINGIKVAFLGYTYGLSNENEITDEEKKSANIYSEELAQKRHRICKTKFKLHNSNNALGRCKQLGNIRISKKYNSILSEKWSRHDFRFTSISCRTNGNNSNRRRKKCTSCVFSWKLYFYFKICKCRCRAYFKHSNCKEFRLRQGSIAKS